MEAGTRTSRAMRAWFAACLVADTHRCARAQPGARGGACAPQAMDTRAPDQTGSTPPSRCPARWQESESTQMACLIFEKRSRFVDIGVVGVRRVGLAAVRGPAEEHAVVPPAAPDHPECLAGVDVTSAPSNLTSASIGATDSNSNSSMLDTLLTLPEGKTPERRLAFLAP